MMADFYSIDLDDNVERFHWEQIEATGDLPGPRSKHALIGGRRRIYLVCGLSSDVRSSNEIFEFDAEKCIWKLLKPEGDKLPEIDSFGCAYISNGEEERIIIACGYDGKNADYLNAVYEYNITKNRISTLFAGTKGHDSTQYFIQKTIRVFQRPEADVLRLQMAKTCIFSAAKTQICA